MWIFNTDHPVAEDTVMFITMNGYAAPFILILINILITLFFLPGIFGALLWGYSYWFITTNIFLVLMAGTGTWFVGFSIGSIIAMYIGRYLAKSWIQKMHEKNKYLKAMSCCFEKKGFKIMFLLRLSPLIPFNVLNYAMGIYPVKLSQFLIANFGMIPGILVYVYIGTAVSSMGALFETNSGGSLIKIIMLAIGLIIAIGAVILIWVYTKKELTKALKEKEDEEEKIKNGENEEEKPNDASEGGIIELELQNVMQNRSMRQSEDNSVTKHGTLKKNSKSESSKLDGSSEIKFERASNQDNYLPKIL